MRPMRLLLGLLLAAVLIFGLSPLVLAFMKAWGLPEEPTFADACLVIIVVLLCILLFKPGARMRGPE